VAAGQSSVKSTRCTALERVHIAPEREYQSNSDILLRKQTRVPKSPLVFDYEDDESHRSCH